MFSWFGKKNGYKSIPDSLDVPSGNKYDEDVHISPMPLPRTQSAGFGDRRATESIRYRGDKRLIERGGDFHQSTGKIGLRKKIKQRYFRALYGMDLFHSLIDAPTPRILAILLGGYMLIIVFFALLYYIISKTMDCNMGIVHFLDGFAFSLETMATIGYGTQDVFFNDCPLPLMVISAQVCVKLIADAVTIGVLYCKLSRPHARASTVIFSEKAIIRRVRGKLYFMFQLCELRKHQLVEAHVRVYVVRNEVDLSHCINDPEDGTELLDSTPKRSLPGKLKHLNSGYAFGSSMSSDEGSMEGMAAVGTYSKMKYHTLPSLPHVAANGTSASTGHHPSFHIHSAASVDNSTNVGRNRTHRPTYMQTSAMRLNHPNDELGGMLLLMTPQVVVHEIDAGSPLMPPPVWYCNFPCDERTGAVHSYGTGAGGGLGSQQVGDQIRWRPPAYKNFIQHVPAQIPSRPSFETGVNQAPFASPATVRGGNVGEKRELPAQTITPRKQSINRRASHRYNGIEEVPLTLQQGNKKIVSQAPTQQVPVPVAEYTEQAAPQSTWFYDAEALARIEFPSVTRRIDTDNISAATLPPLPVSGAYCVQQGVQDGVDGGPTSTPLRQPSGVGAVASPPPQVSVRAPMPMRNSLGGGGVFFGSNSNLAESLRDSQGNQGNGTPKPEPQEGQDWYFQSAGLNSYADLLNPTRNTYNSLSPMREGSNKHTQDQQAQAVNGNGNGRENLESLLEFDIPVTIDEDDDDNDDNSPPQSSSARKNISGEASTNSLSISDTSSPTKSDKATTPVSRIPVFNRGASSYSLLAQPLFPAQVNAGAPAPATTPAVPPALTAPALTTSPEKTSPEKKVGVFQNSARPFPTDNRTSIESVRMSTDGDDESVRTTNTQEGRTLGRAKSKRDMYVSPYKQQRSASMSNVFATPPAPQAPLTPTQASEGTNATQTVEMVAPAVTTPTPAPAAPAPALVPSAVTAPAPPQVAPPAATKPTLTLMQPPGPAPVVKSQEQEPPKLAPVAPRAPVPAPAPIQAPATAAPSAAPPRSSLANIFPYTTNPLYSPPAHAGSGGHNVSFAASRSPLGTSASTTSGVTGAAMGGIREAGDWCSYQTWQSEERSMVQRYMRDRQIEVIVIVEGVDAATGGMVQARHSYTSDEIEWNKSFECCVFKDPGDGCTTIDFSQFHELVDVPDDAPFAGVVHSSI